MNARLDELEARRRALGARSASLRDTLVVDAAGLRARLRSADRLVAVARSGRTRAVLLGTAALVVLGRPRRVLAFALRALALWPLASALWPGIRSLFRPRGTSA